MRERGPQQPRLLPVRAFTAQEFPPVPYLRAAARSLAADVGKRWPPPGLATLQNNPNAGVERFQEFRDRWSSGSADPGTRESYDSMRAHVAKQFRALTERPTRGGLGISVDFTEEDPYQGEGGVRGAATRMADDLRHNRHMSVYKTAEDHFAMSADENDMFRAVHDAFGHAATGRGFSRHGEEAAFLSHRQMFPDPALTALASETRGQNSYLNYGGDGFPDQTPDTPLFSVPEWMTTRSGRKPQPRPKPGRPSGTQGTLF